MEFLSYVEAARKQAGVTHAALEAAVGCRQSWWSQALRRGSCDMDAFIRVCRLLGVAFPESDFDLVGWGDPESLDELGRWHPDAAHRWLALTVGD